MSEEKKFTYLSCFCFLWKYAKPYWLNFLIFFGGCLLDYVLFIAVPILSGIMMDQIVYYQNMSLFGKIGLVQLSIVLFYSYNYFVTYNQHSYLTSHFTYNIKSQSFNHLMRVHSENFSKKNVGEFITIIDDYTSEALNFFTKNFIHNINNFLNVAFCVIYIWVINWKLGLIVTTIVPVSVAISRIFGEKVRVYADEEQQRYAEYNGKVYEWLLVLRDIKLMCFQKKIIRDFAQNNKDLIRLDVKTALTQKNGQTLLDGGQLILQLLLFCALAYFAIVNDITIGSLLVVLAYYSDMRMCVDALVNAHLDAKIRIEYIKSVYDFMNYSEEEVLEGDPIKIKQGDICYENVCFQYGTKPLLWDISFQIQGGSKVAIVGENGCGKSTLTQMLLRFYKPQKGKILIDNTSIDEINLRSLRENIGIVFQETFLFSATIRDNITLGKEEISDDEVLEACKKAGIVDFVKSLPEQLDTIIGDGGRDISGGQCQRIVMARIYLKNPNIVIFDESTSSLDEKTENVILDAWDKTLQGKTVIVIAHRLNSVLRCDDTIVIKDGKVYETGKPHELLQHSKYFKKVFAKEGQQCLGC